MFRVYKKGKNIPGLWTFMTYWSSNRFFHCHSFNSSSACLKFEVSLCPTELPWIQQQGVWVVGGIQNIWPMSHISTHLLSAVLSLLFLLSLLLLCGRTKRKRNNCMHGLNRSETVLSNSHQPCVNPKGGPWEFKTQNHGQKQETHHSQPLVSCWSVM